ncbi:hypothetical protein PG988_006254 [Apiospora saccharicola]
MAESTPNSPKGSPNSPTKTPQKPEGTPNSPKKTSNSPNEPPNSPNEGALPQETEPPISEKNGEESREEEGDEEGREDVEDGSELLQVLEDESSEEDDTPEPEPDTYFWYKDAQRRKIKVGGGTKEPPRFVTEHTINRRRWPARKLYRPPSPPPLPAAQPTRRSARLKEQDAKKAREKAKEAKKAAAVALPPPEVDEAPGPAPTQDKLDVWAVLGGGLRETQTDSCEVCGGWPGECPGEPCYYKGWLPDAREAVESIEVRQTGGDMGLGLYARPNKLLPKGFVLGEYLGELVPDDGTRRSRIKDTSYVFGWDGVMQVDARLVGNHTRFANHHCKPNAECQRIVVGGRRIFQFQTTRQIGPGEQIFVSYGADYFRDMDCVCDAQPGPHKPPR